MAINMAEVRKNFDQYLVKDTERMNAVRLAPRPDNGFYGPGTLNWELAEETPLAFILGIYRGAIEVLFDPQVAESVSTHSVMQSDTLTRARRSIMFFQMAAFGDSESAIRAGRTLYRVHSHINGFDPITMREYDGTSVEMALWTHALGIVAIADAFAQFGRPLSKAEKDRFAAENVPFAQLVGVDPKDVPTTFEGLREIALGWLPRMALGLKGTRDIDFLLRTPWNSPGVMSVAGPALRVVSIAMSRHLAPELLEMARFHPSKFSVRLAEIVVRAIVQVQGRGPLRDIVQIVSPEGWGMMRQAFEADPNLPLAAPEIRANAHLLVRQDGPGNKHSDLEHSPFVRDQATNTTLQVGKPEYLQSHSA
ncbi:oxygenase MpaB family protein [Nocardia sp. NPDC050406]|uniref:oxygenase MpaB family protein n=1 Tax=Nocardia sp. NPDC050406 TaxID=3364318 RepID=UPI0037A4A384